MPLLNFKLFFSFFFVCVLTAIVLSGNAYSKTEPSVLKTINAARVAIDRSKMEESQKQAAIDYLDAARADEKEVDALKEQLAALRAETLDQPKRIEQLQEALAVNREQELLVWSKRIPADADGETLEQILERERTVINDLRAQIEAAGDNLALMLSRPAQAADDISTLHRRIEELSLPLAAAKDEPAALHDARRLRRKSELRKLQAELELHNLEQSTATQRHSLQELSLRELRYRLGFHESRLEYLQQRITHRGRSELESLVQQLIKREHELAQSPVMAVADTAAENRAIGEELLQQNEHLAQDRVALASIQQARAHMTVNLQDSRARLDMGGSNERVGRWLWSERRRLKSTERLQQRLKLIREDLADLRMERVMISEQQRDLLDINGVAGALLETGISIEDGAQADKNAINLLKPLLQKRVELLSSLESLFQRRILALEESEQALHEQIQTSMELQQLLDRNLLWIPGHSLIDSGWLQRLPDGLQDLAKLSRFATTVSLILRDFQQHPLPWFTSLLALLILLKLRHRAPKNIEELAANTYQIQKDSYQITLKALGWTLLAALPAPAFFALSGLLLQEIGNPGRFSHSLGQACELLVLPLLAVQILRWTSIERGLGHAHFRWTSQRREALRSWLPRIAIIVLPLYFISALAFIRRLDLAIDVQARLAIVLSCLMLAWALWRLLDVGKLWVVRGMSNEPSMVRKLLRVSLPLLLLAVAILALSGYVFSAGMILQSLIASFNVIVMVAIVMGLVARWFLLGERRLALRRLEERRLAAAQAATETSEPVPEPEENITLEQVNTQTRRLLRALRISLLVTGLIIVWAGLLPAASRLDEIALWHIGETGPDGATIQQPVSLMAVLLGVFALILTTVGARNLPGLIEISLLSRIGMDAASRYAITSVLRYAIVIGGTLVGLSLLGVRWSQLQWMAAALTVGLGFGLQEIFANFVSGIILLFERPFRVGDVITVGDLTGRVTRIRTRATTILDADNKEIFIPNKTFITGQLINWTLTDTITRVVIRIGVAYGADANQVRALLLQVAREDERVLKEPEPSCSFMAFGASSLDFELRVFVNVLSQRLEIQDALNTKIMALFAEHHIEIAYPQLDVHVRNLPSEFARNNAVVVSNDAIKH
ncbi:MAG: mechanosensitive ion channel [Nitrosomonas sp.]|nr:MAG: mechanosensitive ion channel [Nitrosomonas sp.]